MKAAEKLQPKQSKASSLGRLVGWLVSYAEDKAGEHHELRSGRILISARETDARDRSTITISAADLSSPHAALLAKRNHQVVVQDIFSDHGTFLLRAGSKKEERVEGPVELAHGDWIRFGEANRFQVCLIDGRNR